MSFESYAMALKQLEAINTSNDDEVIQYAEDLKLLIDANAITKNTNTPIAIHLQDQLKKIDQRKICLNYLDRLIAIKKRLLALDQEGKLLNDSLTFLVAQFFQACASANREREQTAIILDAIEFPAYSSDLNLTKIADLRAQEKQESDAEFFANHKMVLEHDKLTTFQQLRTLCGKYKTQQKANIRRELEKLVCTNQSLPDNHHALFKITIISRKNIETTHYVTPKYDIIAQHYAKNSPKLAINQEQTPIEHRALEAAALKYSSVCNVMNALDDNSKNFEQRLKDAKQIMTDNQSVFEYHQTNNDINFIKSFFNILTGGLAHTITRKNWSLLWRESTARDQEANKLAESIEKVTPALTA